MDKNLIWKSVLIVVIVALMGLNLYPPQETLKPGIDLAGGTSLVYEIDVTGLATKERKDLSQNMIPILLKRIDPTHVANIIMRPQGDTRIEIQLPVASMDTRHKRQAYEQALQSLEAENINLLKIRQKLMLGADERATEFDAIAGESQERQEILTKLADAYDQRKQAQDQRDALIAEMDTLKSAIEKLSVEFDTLQYNFASWAKLDA
ncbi:MAG: hypothetical protein ACYSOC_06220, partial [Planctomycetota bacterium]